MSQAMSAYAGNDGLSPRRITFFSLLVSELLVGVLWSRLVGHGRSRCRYSIAGVMCLPAVVIPSRTLLPGINPALRLVKLAEWEERQVRVL